MTQDLPSNSREGANKVPQRPGDATLLVAHLDAAYNMARYLMRNETEAEDVVQSAYVRAISHFAGFRGGDHAPLVDPNNTLSVNRVRAVRSLARQL